jgi:N-acetylglucosamine-6-phosphate deacetylase
MIPEFSKTIITDVTVIHPDRHPFRASVVIEAGKILAVSETVPGALLLNHENVGIVSGQHCYLTPGLIELHFNGALGCNLNQTKISALQHMLKTLPQFGITGALLTVITNPLTEMLSSIHTLEEAIHHQQPEQARPLGIHLEGPFLSPQFPGIHPQSALRTIDMQELPLLLSPMTKMITLAPELPNSLEAIRFMTRQRNIRVSLGHSAATAAEAVAAVEAGACSVTHLFNAMRPFHHREPGITGSALGDDTVFVQCVGDGVHLHPQTLNMILKAKPKNRVLLTSDASPAAELPEGSRLNFAAQEVTVSGGGKVFNPQGQLAGSGQLISDCVRNLVRWGLCTFPDAIQYASANPAQFLGEPLLGRIEPGMLADLVLWNKQTLAIEATFIEGQLVYQASGKLAESTQGRL